ncbi:MAG TPA: zinc-binding alcohol dehydrogenase family protein [Mycobacterium sp.]|nr:zinc-binding alcohol dehydrogenase family protein [Mycobacterium sp.]
MKAAVVEAWGQPPRYADFTEPSPRDGAVVVTVEASALTNLSRGLMSGNHYASKEIQLPAVAGVDGVARLADGRLVYTGALPPFGMMAERALINPDAATPLPDNVDPVTAAALPNPGLSAWMSLDYAAAVKPGAHVLVLGATGVTGSVAVQLAKSVFGAQRVVVAGRNPERLRWLRGVGADDVITLGKEDLSARVAEAHAAQPFDAVLDYLWGGPAETTLTALASSHSAAHFHTTRFVQIGAMAGPTMNLDAGILRGNGITLTGMGIGSVPFEVLGRARTEGLPRLLAMLAAGELQIETKQRPLAEVTDAWSGAEPSGTRVVLTP